MQEVVRNLAGRRRAHEEGDDQRDFYPAERDDDTDLRAYEEKSVVAMNTLDQNANAVEEPVFAVVLSFGGASGMIAEALLHDERVIAVRDEFLNASDEEVSDEDGCLSRSMTIKAISPVMTERIWINCAASEVVFQLSHPDTGDPLHDESVIAVR